MTSTTLQRIRAFVSLLTGAYALGLLIFLVLRLMTNDGLWWVALLANFTPFYFAAFAVLLPLALLFRAKRGALLMLPLVVVGAIWFGRLYLPKAQAQAGDAPTLRVVSFNVWGDNPNIVEVEDWLREMRADVAIIIEMPSVWADGLPALTETYPEQLILSDTSGLYWDSAVLSRYPLVSAEQIDLGDGEIPQSRIVVEVDGRQIAVYGIHLYVPVSRTRQMYQTAGFYNDSARDSQIRTLLHRLEDEPLPYVVAGDFNMSDQTVIYNELAALMGDSFREAGRGLGTSWPNFQRFGLTGLIPPLVRIDYIWHSNDFRAIEAAQGPYLGSDHLPLYATLALES
ncbi:MAG: endonuclease/exonuclease/phosphatase family protein [Chloroflexota bacterium]